MTLDEKIGLVHGHVAFPFNGKPKPNDAIGSAGYVEGVPRLPIPALQESDAGLGVTNPHNVRPGDVTTPFPAGLAMAATFDAALVERAAAMIGAEARAKGFNVLLAGGANLARDPRNGRNFEYVSEEILLMILGFMVWWPVGFMVLAFIIGSRRVGCRYLQDKMERLGRGDWWGYHSSNRAFDEYRTETLKRMEDEQREFRDFLARLRQAKDKAEFDQFMAERRNRPPEQASQQA